MLLSVLADGPPRAVAKASARVTRDSGQTLADQNNPADRRDVLLLLDGGPLHLRMHLSLGGVSLAEARRHYVSRLIESLDADHDGKQQPDHGVTEVAGHLAQHR